MNFQFNFCQYITAVKLLLDGWYIVFWKSSAKRYIYNLIKYMSCYPSVPEAPSKNQMQIKLKSLFTGVERSKSKNFL